MNLPLIYSAMALSFIFLLVVSLGSIAAERMCQGSKKEKDDAMALLCALGVLTLGAASFFTIVPWLNKVMRGARVSQAKEASGI